MIFLQLYFTTYKSITGTNTPLTAHGMSNSINGLTTLHQPTLAGVKFVIKETMDKRGAHCEWKKQIMQFMLVQPKAMTKFVRLITEFVMGRPNQPTKLSMSILLS